MVFGLFFLASVLSSHHSFHNASGCCLLITVLCYASLAYMPFGAILCLVLNGYSCGCCIMSYLCSLGRFRLGLGSGFYSSSAVWVCVVGQMFLGFVVSLWFLAALFLCSGRSGILFLYKVPIFGFLLVLAICRCSLTALDFPVLSVHVYMPVCV